MHIHQAGIQPSIVAEVHDGEAIESAVAEELHGIAAIGARNLRRATVWRVVWAIAGLLIALGMVGTLVNKRTKQA